ncbi:subunit B of calcineurin [Chloropicon primus]|uniref:Subunit B of calcineurin n=1 Tax=Chloropicon primus TaxID=1764295 RepID=A0A5B8ML31_9CHLO|nr:subunit B of calcineurin [Chloropicon primus]UPR00388.1 subunit B of calcineurin [Chloropicon primus]|eukprot:QDZ21176.1 subunit B of calcineurin [Chloropicon primus]
MGQGLSFDLTQGEIEDLQKGCEFKFSQTEIQVLYKRFLKLDKDKKGFISTEEFLAIPEFSLNPLAQRLVSIFENVNFKDFLHILSAFSPKASMEEKLQFLFNFHDVDGDGYVSRLDLEHVVRQRVGASLSESQMDQLLTRVMEESGSKQERLDFKAFCKCFQEDEDFSLGVDIPSDDELW